LFRFWPILSLVVIPVHPMSSSKCCYTLISSTCLSLSVHYMFNFNESFHATFPEHCMLSGYCSSNFLQQDLLLISPRTIHVVLCITVDLILSTGCKNSYWYAWYLWLCSVCQPQLDWLSVWFRTPWTRTWTWTAPWFQVLYSGFGWTKPLGHVHVHRPAEPNLTAWTRTFRVWGWSRFIFKFPTPNQMVCSMSLIMPS